MLVADSKLAFRRPTGPFTSGVAGAQGGQTMLYYALVFLIVGLIAGALGLAELRRSRDRSPGFCSSAVWCCS